MNGNGFLEPNDGTDQGSAGLTVPVIRYLENQQKKLITYNK